jgi:hypothetical protein
MAHPFGAIPSLGEVIEKARQLGCVVRELTGEIVGPDGPFKVRYLFNPRTQGFVILSDMPDGEPVLPTTVGHIERRLGIVTGFPSAPHPDDNT